MNVEICIKSYFDERHGDQANEGQQISAGWCDAGELVEVFNSLRVSLCTRLCGFYILLGNVNRSFVELRSDVLNFNLI